jgi:hypothetical protein
MVCYPIWSLLGPAAVFQKRVELHRSTGTFWARVRKARTDKVNTMVRAIVGMLIFPLA